MSAFLPRLARLALDEAREAGSARRLLLAAGMAVGATAALVLFLWMLIRVRRRVVEALRIKALARAERYGLSESSTPGVGWALRGLALLVRSVSVVVGAVLVYILCAQISSGIVLLQEAPGGFDFETGLLIGLSILLGTIVAFLPAEVLAGFPATLRPVLGNGFVVGVVAALMMEHLVFRKK